MNTEPGYEAAILLAFVRAHSDTNADGRVYAFNDVRMTESHRDMLDRWTRLDVVPLRKLDPFLVRYDLHLSELELWAHANYGRDGWVDEFEAA